jgi:hypothetical protein
MCNVQRYGQNTEEQMVLSGNTLATAFLEEFMVVLVLNNKGLAKQERDGNG